MNQAFNLTIDSKGIARLVFDLPGEKINKLSIAVLEELDSILEELKGNRQVKALVLTSAKDGVFIAGADLDSFEYLFKDLKLADQTIQMGHRVLNKLEALPFPSIAVINGACLGGGLELALACTYRVVGDHPKTSLGLPEVSIGIFPGWGGTQRLPRLVGLTEGLKIIVGGARVDAKKSWQIKLADAVYAWQFLDEKVEEFIRECLTEKGMKKIWENRKRNDLMTMLLEKNPIGRFLVYWQTKQEIIKKTKGQYPAPFAALALIENTYTLSLKEGLKEEIKAFARGMSSDFRYAPNLLQVYFNSEALKKNPGYSEGFEDDFDGECDRGSDRKCGGERNRGYSGECGNEYGKGYGREGGTEYGKDLNDKFQIKSTAVIGAGTMGAGIAWLLSSCDIPVRMKDINWEAIGRGYASAWDTYKTLIRIRKLKPDMANRRFHLIGGTIDYSGFQHVDFVIEAATEDLKLKHVILKELESNIHRDAIIGTNTSSLTIKELSSALQYPERLVGLHFFNPPSRMPLVEVVAGEETSPEVVRTAVDLCKKLKKTPIVVKDCAGFLVNRVFVAGFMEVLWMLGEGVPMEKLEKALLDFGMPMAPFVLADEVGNDVNLKVCLSLEKAYGERMSVPSILRALNERGLYGKKTNKGFYLYEGKSRKINPQIQEIVNEQRNSGENGGEKGGERGGERGADSNLSQEEIVDRCFIKMINEAARCLEEKVVLEAGHLDTALVYGIGFPPFRGGLLCYADTIGVEMILHKLRRFEEKCGARYSPAPLLKEMEREQVNFYTLSHKQHVSIK